MNYQFMSEEEGQSFASSPPPPPPPPPGGSGQSRELYEAIQFELAQTAAGSPPGGGPPNDPPKRVKLYDEVRTHVSWFPLEIHTECYWYYRDELRQEDKGVAPEKIRHYYLKRVRGAKNYDLRNESQEPGHPDWA